MKSAEQWRHDLYRQERDAEPLPNPPVPEYLRREMAAQYISNRVGIPYSVGALEQAAKRGNGPPYKVWNSARGGRGRFAVYRIADLDSWIARQLGEE